MDAAHRLNTLRSQGEQAIKAAEDRLDAAVPHLEWSVGELLIHLAGVHARFTQSLRSEIEAWPARESVTVPDNDLADWARGHLADVATAIRVADLDAHFTTWAGPQNGSWILRRLANETTIHRWDLQAASGPPEDVAGEVAVDIIDEFLIDIVGERGLAGVDDGATRDGATIHLHATDTDAGEWVATVTDTGVTVERRHGKADVALRGSAGDLALWVNGRLPASRLEAFGTAEAVDWWSRALRFD
jgi:uncharacterized protein (TIGR03083 family)